jgi:hypothetical protein
MQFLIVGALKCGLEQPSCVRCLKSGVQCSGPRTGPIFIRRDINNVQSESDREMLLRAIRNQSNTTSGELRRSVRAAYGAIPPVNDPFPLATIPSLGYSRDFYRSVVEEFWSSTCDPAKNSTRRAIQASILICVQVILPLAFQNKALDAAIFAASTMYLGRLRADAKLRALAMAAYPTALSRFCSELVLASDSKTEQRSQEDLIVATVLSLLLFEVRSP